MEQHRFEEYARMMGDDVRMDAYRRAIDATCPGRVVCEIGVGLGPLSLMALQSGAKHVYGIERDAAALCLAVEVIRAAGFGPDRFTAIQSMSTDAELPERAEVLLTETVDGIGIGENTVLFVRDARQRLLVPQPILLPTHLRCFVAPAFSAQYEADRRFFGQELKKRYGLDYSPVLRTLAEQRRSVTVGNADLLGPWASWLEIDLGSTADLDGPVETELYFERSGISNGIATAFEMELTPEISFATLPSCTPTHWGQGFCPFPASLEVEAGVRIGLRMSTESSEGPWIGLAAELQALPI